MNLKAILGTTFLSVLAALVVYDLVVKSAIAKVMNKYDNTFDPSASAIQPKMKIVKSEKIEPKNSHLENLLHGREIAA